MRESDGIGAGLFLPRMRSGCRASGAQCSESLTSDACARSSSSESPSLERAPDAEGTMWTPESGRVRAGRVEPAKSFSSFFSVRLSDCFR